MELIQIDAAVNPGNSGGALFNMYGQLVGIVNAKYAHEEIEGFGFAIPIDVAAKIAQDLIQYGYVTGRTNAGITVEYANPLMLQNGSGLWITAVADGSNCETAGIKKYDQLLSITYGDKNYIFTSAAEVNAFLEQLPINSTVTFELARYKEKQSTLWSTTYTREVLTFTVTLTEYTQ